MAKRSRFRSISCCAARHASRPLPAAQRVEIGDHTHILANALPLTLGQLSYILGDKLALGDYFRSALADGAWFTNECAATIDERALARNPPRTARRYTAPASLCGETGCSQSAATV